MRLGSVEWLVGEIISFRGEAIVLEPDEIRTAVGRRATELRKELFGRRRSRAAR
jgi:predicted DNA-binding transcriptional regulator YafY